MSHLSLDTDRETAIAAVRLSKIFGKQRVLHQIDLAIPAGRCVGLIGANGTGKTTLLRCLAGLVRATAGDVRWFGQPAMQRPDRRCLVGMVGHDSRLYPHLTLRENLLFAARMYGMAQPGQRSDQLLEHAGLASRADLRPGQISRGMQQRLAITRALMHDPPILLLDEPFSGLDADGSWWLLQTLLDLRAQGRTICFSSHDPAQTEQLADVVFELHAGRLQESAELRERVYRNGVSLRGAA